MINQIKIGENEIYELHRGQLKKVTVLIKKVKNKLSDQFLKEFINECLIMYLTRHPNICLFYGAVLKENQLAIV